MPPQGGMTLAQALVQIGVDDIGLEKDLDNARRRVDDATADMSRSGRTHFNQIRDVVKAASNDMSQLAKEMGHVEVSAKRAAAAVRQVGPGGGMGRGGGRGPRGGKGFGGRGQGLLELSYLTDDLQYGMHAVVNNIPGVIQKLGGGAGLAGVVGILAVGVAALTRNFGSLGGALAQTTTFQVAAMGFKKIAEAAAYAAEKIGDLTGLTQLYQKAAEQQAMEAKRAAGDELVKGIMGEKTPAQQSKAATFDETLKDYGGAGKLLDDTMKRLGKGGKVTPEVEAERRRNVARAIEEARQGGNVNFGMFGRGFENMYNERTPQAKERMEGIKKQLRETEDLADKQIKEENQRREKAERERKQAAEKAADERAREVGRYAGSFAEGGVGNVLLKDPGDKMARTRVRTQLQEMGMGGPQAVSMAKEIVEAIKKALEQQVQARMAEKGETADQARAAILEERVKAQIEAEEAMKPKSPAATVTTQAEWTRGLQVAAFGEGSDMKKQTKLQERIRDLIDEQNKTLERKLKAGYE